MIAGIYGMNFDNMPELHWHYGYFIAVGVMAAACVGLFRAFRSPAGSDAAPGRASGRGEPVCSRRPGDDDSSTEDHAVAR